MSAPGDADKAGGGKRRRFGPEFIPLNISAPFIRRPVATTLLTIAIALAGMVAFGLLPWLRCLKWTFPWWWCARACPAPARKPWPPP